MSEQAGQDQMINIPDRLFSLLQAADAGAWDWETDITERKRQEEQISLLMREVNHRSKNILTLVQAIARQTAASRPADFSAPFLRACPRARGEPGPARQERVDRRRFRPADPVPACALQGFHRCPNCAERTRSCCNDAGCAGSWHGSARTCDECWQIWSAIKRKWANPH